jgi:hypothetical protein
MLIKIAISPIQKPFMNIYYFNLNIFYVNAIIQHFKKFSYQIIFNYLLRIGLDNQGKLLKS